MNGLNLGKMMKSIVFFLACISFSTTSFAFPPLEQYNLNGSLFKLPKGWQVSYEINGGIRVTENANASVSPTLLYFQIPHSYEKKEAIIKRTIESMLKNVKYLDIRQVDNLSYLSTEMTAKGYDNADRLMKITMNVSYPLGYYSQPQVFNVVAFFAPAERFNQLGGQYLHHVTFFNADPKQYEQQLANIDHETLACKDVVGRLKPFNELNTYDKYRCIIKNRRAVVNQNDIVGKWGSNFALVPGGGTIEEGTGIVIMDASSSGYSITLNKNGSYLITHNSATTTQFCTTVFADTEEGRYRFNQSNSTITFYPKKVINRASGCYHVIPIKIVKTDVKPYQAKIAFHPNKPIMALEIPCGEYTNRGSACGSDGYARVAVGKQQSGAVGVP
jgi:hypothetical protein